VFGPPQFTQPLQSLELPENQIALFEAQVIPVNDPSLQIQWFLNDTPLGQSNRFAISNDFGYVTLRINGVRTHDQGVYSCKAVNSEGAAITSASLTVHGEDSLQLGTLHENSLAKIQHLGKKMFFSQKKNNKIVTMTDPFLHFQRKRL